MLLQNLEDGAFDFLASKPAAGRYTLVLEVRMDDFFFIPATVAFNKNHFDEY